MTKDNGTSSPSNDHSYYYKAGSIKLAFTTVGEQLELVAREHPEKIAIKSVHQGIKKTYRELNYEADILAANLLQLGLNKGDRVGIWGRNSYEWILFEFALAKTGMIMVTICPAYQSDELEYSLKHVKCKAIVMQENMETIDYYGILCQVEPEIATNMSKTLSSNKLPHLKHVILISNKPKMGSLDFKELTKTPTKTMMDNLSAIRVEPDDAFCIQYTSGTTGRAKAAVVTHFQCCNVGLGVAERFNYNQTLVFLLQVPLYHSMGCVIGVCTLLASQGTAIIPSARYNSVASLEAIEKERCTSMFAAPTMIIDMMSKPELNSIDISSLKTAGIGGAFCHKSVIESFTTTLNIKVLVGYGCTETSGVVSIYELHDQAPQLHQTAGKPLDLLEIKIVNEKGNIVKMGEEGEILVRGYSMFLGYWDDEAKTKEAMTSDRWYHTGDLGKLDKEGFLYVVGRQKDMIIRGGENIYPVEIEQFLLKHPAIKDVQIVGVPDDKMGEEACAWISLKPGMILNEVDVKSYCKGKITHFKIPRYVFFADVFPTTVSGKVQKYKLKKFALEKLNLIR